MQLFGVFLHDEFVKQRSYSNSVANNALDCIIYDTEWL